MKANYILRMDDACPTMHGNWECIERILDRHGIRPIVAVIPANADPQMNLQEARPHFWDIVRRWQEKGWFIALHGYDHVYTQQQTGLLGIGRKSEFAGLPYAQQAEKIEAGLAIFAREQVEARCWVAPSHSFDRDTLKALTEKSRIRIISDGLALHPFRQYGFNWIPQQLWRFRTMPFGTWTFCLHPNTMKENDLQRLDDFLTQHAGRFIDPSAIQRFTGLHLFDTILQKTILFLLKRKHV